MFAEHASEPNSAKTAAAAEGPIERAFNLTAVIFNTGFSLLAIVTLAGMVFITRPKVVLHEIAPEMWLPLLIVMGPAQIYAQFLSWRTVRAGETPSGPAIASRQYDFPWVLRPAVAFFWLCNFVIGLAIVVSLSKPHPGQPPLGFGALAFLGLLTFWLAFAANVYLSLAVKTATRDDELLYGIWKYRIVIDVITALFAVAYYRL